MIRESISMRILVVILSSLFMVKCYASNASCVPCTFSPYRSCYNCLNTFPVDRSHAEKVNIVCNVSQRVFGDQDRFYSIIKAYVSSNCTMKTFFLDQYTLWNYLESMSITHARLTRLSPVIFNRSLSVSPILYSIKTLNFSHNSFRVLNKNFSYYFPSLQTLDLSYNHLILIRKKTFINLIHLKELYLNNNYLKQILSSSFPRQSLRAINLDGNHWHCSCRNVLTLAVSRPVPVCQTPIHYKNQSAGDIAQQCFMRRRANILVTTNVHNESNLTCALASAAEAWKNKTAENITVLSVWHLEQRQAMTMEHLSTLTNKSENYLICFNLTSAQPESIHAIFPLTFQSSTANNATRRSLIILKPSTHLSPFLLWMLNTSKKLLPTYFRTSDKQVLITWLVLLSIAFVIFSFLIYLVYYQRSRKADYRVHSFSNRFLHFEKKPDSARTIFNMKINCKNHKCLCQYRRNEHSLVYAAEMDDDINVRPLLIQPAELRYAKIKRISSTKDLDQDDSTGHFRTIVKLKNST